MITQRLYVTRITADLKNAIKDCLCSLFYRKKDLIDFFQTCNFTKTDMKCVDANETKSSIIDLVFHNLAFRPDQGSMQIRSVINSLINWSDFDSYWFANGSLDKNAAKLRVDNLKKLLGEKTKQEEDLSKRKEKEEERVKSITKQKTLEELNKRFSQLCQMSEFAQRRGYELETLLVELFHLNGIEVESPFKLKGEQIDGSINFMGDNYIFEAKWQNAFSAVDTLYTFAYKIESNTLYPRGIFLSINGYSEEAITRITHNKKPQLVLLDSSDLLFVLEGRMGLVELLKLKIKYAQTRGNIYINVYQLLSVS